MRPSRYLARTARGTLAAKVDQLVGVMRDEDACRRGCVIVGEGDSRDGCTAFHKNDGTNDGTCNRWGYAVMMAAQTLTIAIDGTQSVSGLWLAPPGARACLVLAHGAGAGMTHKAMVALADGLAERGIATLRYQFPYMEKGTKRPDPPAIAQAAVRAAVAEARLLAPELALFAGGRSFGGRMTSQAQALVPLPGVRGLVFFAFPLHPAGKPSTERAEHLADVGLPMLFLQGTNDALAQIDLLRPTVAQLGARARLELFADADHSFHVPARTGRKDADVLVTLLDAAAEWITAHSGSGGETTT